MTKLEITTGIVIQDSDGESYLAQLKLDDRDMGDVEFTTSVQTVRNLENRVLINPNAVVVIDERDN